MTKGEKSVTLDSGMDMALWESYHMNVQHGDVSEKITRSHVRNFLNSFPPSNGQHPKSHTLKFMKIQGPEK